MLGLLIFMTALLGQYSSEDIKDCRRHTCYNGGTCLDRTEGPLCVCKRGWTGDDCSENIDDCATAMCFNGATCIDRVASFLCVCPVGKTGLLCQLDDPCLSNPCGKGALCDTNPIYGRYTCTFPTGSVGEDSNQDKDGYSTVSDSNGCQKLCHNGGTCINTNEGHACVCVNGWSGDDCSENIDDCATPACANGATCHDRVGYFFCECPVGKTGLLCQLDDACINNPCGKGALCNTNPISGRYTCTFPRGSLRENSNQDKDGNSTVNDSNGCQKVCHNGGHCINSNEGPACVCVTGWSGDDCSENIDDCAAPACFHGATCIDRVASFVCECPVGKTGLLCHLDDACISNPCAKGAECDTNPVSGRYICNFPSGSVARP